jgi:hypothetical protein
MLNRSAVLSAVALTVSLAAFALVPADALAAASPGAPVGRVGEGTAAGSAPQNLPAAAALPDPGGCRIVCVLRVCVCL